MKVFLIKPFGYENYVVLKEAKELSDFMEESVDGDEFVLKVLEMDEQEFNQLEEFKGF